LYRARQSANVMPSIIRGMQAMRIWCFTIFLGISAAQAFGELRSEKPDEATNVIVGAVKGVFSRESGNVDQRLVMIEIETVEKGAGFAPGEVLYARSFRHRKKLIDKVLLRSYIGSAGHMEPPKEGQRIRAFLINHDGVLDGIYPRWFESASVQK
jgi:hypothetical protein